MGLFDILFKKRSEDQDINKIHNSLKNSFSNIKEDMTHLHKTVSSNAEHNSKKFQELDYRLKRMENLLINFNLQQNKQYEQKVVVAATPILRSDDEEEVEEFEKGDLMSVLKGIPKAELKLFKTLYDLQLNLNAKQISYKSLASYLYPGKEYNSIRSTITQFVLRLHTEGLLEKQRIGKETYVRISSNGIKILKDARIKKIIRELEIND